MHLKRRTRTRICKALCIDSLYLSVCLSFLTTMISFIKVHATHRQGRRVGYELVRSQWAAKGQYFDQSNLLSGFV